MVPLMMTFVGMFAHRLSAPKFRIKNTFYRTNVEISKSYSSPKTIPKVRVGIIGDLYLLVS